MFALTLCAQTPVATDPNPREVVEAYLNVALAGKMDDAVKLAALGQSPSWERNVMKFKDEIGGLEKCR